MKYTNKEHSVIQDGNRSIPCVKGNRDYDEIVENGLLDSVEPYVEPPKSYLDLRAEEYGSVREQLEYIVENGVDAFVARQNAIKAKYPKP